MSKKRKLSSKGREIASLIQKFKRQHPNAERDIARTVIRLENPQLFKTLDSKQNDTNLRMLDRYLAEASLHKRTRKAKPTPVMVEGDLAKYRGGAFLPSQFQSFTVTHKSPDEP